MQTTDSPKRPLVHPSAGAKGTVRVGCVLGIQGALQRGQEPLHPCRPAAAQHHQPRRGSARRAVLRLVHCQAALHAQALVRGKLCGATQVEGASTCLATAAPGTLGERGMASDVQEGRGKADNGGRAHLRDHLYHQS